ncbi:CUB domain [Nesidiocoris tenuis]|uniref:CUB domain n=1 Tax=Nesidiocoris tenuis TaxID=355587 RepID=A0ABN7B818_9HEMI|nr:CUB domain [Nesidiocoris tenuis]
MEHPFNTGSCDECWEGRLDKLIVWEPGSTNSTKAPLNSLTGGHCLCKNTNVLIASFTKSKPVARIVSSTESLFLELNVDGAHSASSYFKHPAPLFEAKYEFVHSPLCGPAVIPASTEGELHFPHLEALGYTEPPRSIRCIWEIRVNRDRDVWLHFDKVKFTTRECQDGRLEVFLPSRPDYPFLSICGHNVSSKDMPPLTSLDLTPSTSTGYLPQPSVKIQFIGTTTPARAAFKIAWTELFHLPRNPDGTLMTSKLTENGATSSPDGSGGGDCEFLCPGESGLCIPASLVCNGIVNCPAVGGRYNESLETGDEAPDVCRARTEAEDVNWLMISLGAGGGVLLAVASLLLVCRCCCCCCCNKRPDDEEDY